MKDNTKQQKIRQIVALLSKLDEGMLDAVLRYIERRR